MNELLSEQLEKWLWKPCQEGWTALTEFLMPRVCPVCRNGLARGEEHLCTSCLADFPFAHPDLDKSGKILEGFDPCLRPEKLHALFYYDKYAAYKNLIYAVKYRSSRLLGVYLGRMLGEHMAGRCRADCIVPVPLHPKRLRQRGFNQAAEIAAGVQRVLQIELLEQVLCRVRNNVSQTGKNAEDRKKNVENIFRLCEPSRIAGRHVLLLDDVITTGATVAACMRELSKAGNVTFSLGCLACTT